MKKSIAVILVSVLFAISGTAQELIPFRNGIKWGYIDQKGKEVIPLQYEIDQFGFDQFQEGMAKAQQNTKWGFIDKSGNIVIPYIYGEAGLFNDDLAEVFNHGGDTRQLIGCIDKEGTEYWEE